MVGSFVKRLAPALMALITAACGGSHDNAATPAIDTLITGGLVYTGAQDDAGASLDIGLAQGRIAFIGDAQAEGVAAATVIDAQGLIVAPGFIDPHTHSLGDLLLPEKKLNANYLTQGVTTVFAGNDGGGPVAIGDTLTMLATNGIGTNVGLFVGHNSIRKAAIGDADRAPSQDELAKMRVLVDDAMTQGALGLSSGLYYAPGTFAKTDELIELARVAGAAGGVYESHIRDESSYSVGLLGAIDEAIAIGAASDTPVHIAHIKALGVDVWGQSKDVIERIETARRNGQRVTADQYPWRASGTRVSNALAPNWAKDGGTEALNARLQSPALLPRLRAEMAENLRKRGGPETLLIVASEDDAIVGKTLEEIANAQQTDPITAAIAIILAGDARIASFNMQESDIEAFMREPWVATSSDGTNGHPRKFASFPRKYRKYVTERTILTEGEFIRRSSGLTADIFGLCGRGYIKKGFAADIVVFDPANFRDEADFSQPRLLSSGVEYLFVNGVSAIERGEVTNKLGGAPVRRAQCED